jgi:hypothetical protein
MSAAGEASLFETSSGIPVDETYGPPDEPGPGAVSADAPTQQGWWDTSTASTPGAPTPPAPADVPPQGLLIEGGLGSSAGPGDTGPDDYAALSY